jgi:hypothetical protein
LYGVAVAADEHDDYARAERRTRIALALILAAGLALRLGWGLSRPTDAKAVEALPDQVGYVRLAERLLSDGELSFVDERFGQRVYAIRTPGYPLFIAGLGANVRAVRAAQAVVDASTALAVFVLARRLIPSRRRALPLVAATVVAFNPFLVYFSALLLTETLFTAMLAWAMVLMTWLHRPPWGLFGGMVVLALSIHIRPSGVGLPAVLGAAAVAWAGRTQPVRRWVWRSCLTAFGGVLLAFLVLLPWAWRNSLVFDGRWVWSTTNDGITAYDGFHPAATGASDQRFVLGMREELSRMGEVGRNDYFASEARRFVREDPARVAKLAVRKVARTWSPRPLSDEFGRRLYVLAALLFSVPFDVLVIVGLIRGRLGWRAMVFLALPALYFTAVHAISVGSLRYRVPAEPPLAVIAAAGAGALSRGRGRTM